MPEDERLHPDASSDALTPCHTGEWLVTTLNTCHLWDLDRMTYQRIPGTRSHAMRYDWQVMRIIGVHWWPIVGKQFLIHINAPLQPPLTGTHRFSATIARIDQVRAPDQPKLA